MKGYYGLCINNGKTLTFKNYIIRPEEAEEIKNEKNTSTR